MVVTKASGSDQTPFGAVSSIKENDQMKFTAVVLQTVKYLSISIEKKRKKKKKREKKETMFCNLHTLYII